MMIRNWTTSALTLALSLTLLPLTAHAYLSPEEVLDDTTYSTRFLPPPPLRRDIRSVVEEQARRSAERREAALDAIRPQPVEEEMHEAAPEAPAEPSELDKMLELIKLLESNGAGSSSLDPATQRLMLRIQAQKDEEQRAALIESILGEGEILHSGAPLADTGPATVLMVIGAALAIGETIRRVRKTESASML